MIMAGVVAEGRKRGAGFGFYKSLTVDHTQCGSSDSTNFPVLVSFTDADLKSVANGGHVNSASGFDVAFSSDSAGVTLLPFELVTYVATTGYVEFWVNLPSLSHAADTVFYMQYGGSATMNQSDKAGTWPGVYKAVYHFGDSTTLSVADSSQSGNTLVAQNSPMAVAGQAGGGVCFNGSSQYLVNSAPSGMPSGDSNPIVLECWFKLAGGGSGTAQEMFGFGNNPGGTASRFACFYDGAGHVYCEVGTNQNYFNWTFDSNWHHFVAVLPTGSTDLNSVLLYFDGVLQTPTLGSDITFTLPSSSLAITVGCIPTYFGGFFTNGDVDECRIGTFDPSADWITAEFNNQSDPSTFMSEGSETAH